MRLSDFVLEYDISSTSVADIEIAGYFSEMEVLGSLLDCYSKYLTVTEYASEDSAMDEFNIFMEAEGAVAGKGKNPFAGMGDKLKSVKGKVSGGVSDTKDKVSSVGSKIKETAGKFFAAIGDVIKAIVNKFIDIFTKFDFKKIVKKLESLPEGTIFLGADYYPEGVNAQRATHILYMGARMKAILAATEEFVDAVRSGETDASAIHEIKTGFEAGLADYQKELNVSQEIKISDLIDLCKELDALDAVPKAKKILKAANFNKDNYKDRVDILDSKGLVAEIKGTATFLSNEYGKANAQLMKLAKVFLKVNASEVKADAKAKKKKEKDSGSDDAK